MRRLLPLLVCLGTALFGFQIGDCDGDRITVDCDLCQFEYTCCPIGTGGGCAGRVNTPGDKILGYSDCMDNTSGKPSCTFSNCQNVNLYIQVIDHCNSNDVTEVLDVYLCCNLSI